MSFTRFGRRRGIHAGIAASAACLMVAAGATPAANAQALVVKAGGTPYVVPLPVQPPLPPCWLSGYQELEVAGVSICGRNGIVYDSNTYISIEYQP